MKRKTDRVFEAWQLGEDFARDVAEYRSRRRRARIGAAAILWLVCVAAYYWLAMLMEVGQ